MKELLLPQGSDAEVAGKSTTRKNINTTAAINFDGKPLIMGNWKHENLLKVITSSPLLIVMNAMTLLVGTMRIERAMYWI